MNPRPRARIGITLGDPRGIGHEVTVAALADAVVEHAADFTLIGPEGLLRPDFPHRQVHRSADGAQGSFLHSDAPCQRASPGWANWYPGAGQRTRIGRGRQSICGDTIC